MPQAPVTSQPVAWQPAEERGLVLSIAAWLRANPDKQSDSKRTVIIRTLGDRIIGNLRNPALPAYPTEVSRETVWGTLIRTYGLDKAQPDYAKWVSTMDEVWDEATPSVLGWFTKLLRTDGA